MVPQPANCNANQHDFIVGQDGCGQWLAVETHGLGAGLFRDRDAALRYALAETDHRPGAVVMVALASLPPMSLPPMGRRCAA